MSGLELKRAILELGMTIAEFSRSSDISDTTLMKIFNGEHVRETTRHKAMNAYRRLKTTTGTRTNGQQLAAG